MRLFVAVWPGADAVAAIAAMPRPELPGVRWTTPDQWHVTLRFLGSVGDDEVAGAAQAMTGAMGTMATEAAGGGLVATMGPAVSRFGPRILHVPVAGLDALAGAVVAATAAIGEPPDDRPFAGHITLARVRARPRSRSPVDLRPLCGVPLAGEWPVHRVTLVASHPQPTGARYDVITSAPCL